MFRSVRLIIARHGYLPDTSGWSFVYEFDSKYCGVDDIRNLEDASCNLFLFKQAHLLNSSAVSALLKRVEDGSASFYFITDSFMSFNKALASRCVREVVLRTGTVDLSYFDLLSADEKPLFYSLLGKASIVFSDISKESIDFSKVFDALSTALFNKPLFPDVADKFWTNLHIILDPSFFTASKYCYLFLWRRLNA